MYNVLVCSNAVNDSTKHSVVFEKFWNNGEVENNSTIFV